MENQEPEIDSVLQRSIRKTYTDYWFKESIINNKEFKNILFVRLVASQKTKFTNVDFSFCIFDHAYLRGCSFDNCVFTGCKFINSNFQSSSFIKCNFKYSFFDKTYIDDDLVDNNLPEEKNLRQRLLRTLRINYQQLGDSKSVNKMMILELNATYEYLKSASFSDDEYYVKKYGGFRKRSNAIFSLICFIFWDFIWGNGEKITNLIRSFLLVLTLIVMYDMINVGEPNSDSIKHLINSIFRSVSIFFSIDTPKYFSNYFLTIVVFFRLFLFALFISIFVKRLNRR